MITEQIKTIAVETLVQEVTSLKQTEYDLVAITCTYDEMLELSYSFEKEQEFLHLRLVIDRGTQLASISQLYAYAFLYENEIKELFDVKITGITIDFENQLYQIAEKTPFITNKEES
ncbi:MAG TPA: NADH-quinone oxidoreductase subunit C [Candidatus Avacidaminococcus intestinavium]|uniref:NADH-quinone oxidoreductase subunit C n=1 Tax=Candidatus Avacidaminococcus intestinavium TaxID=2840684 RepID=A0A9D1SLU7_9FIRM|nr:NADH-quinone oxidoreductase subunit C [Candidatus Avacidaminococcus intestinavium]